VLTYGLIYGYVGLPALGAAGSAWGTFASRLLGAVLLVWVLWQGSSNLKLSDSLNWWPNLRMAKKVLWLGIPAALEEVIIIVAFAALTPIIAFLGTEVIAAHRAVIAILSLSFLPGIGFGLAATALVGQSIGAGNLARARAVTTESLRLAVIWMGAFGLLFLLLPGPIMQIFNASPAMKEAGSLGIQVVALVQPFWAGTFVYGGALRGTGDTRTPLIVSSSMMWLVVVLAWLALHVLPSLAAVWGMFLIAGPIEVWLLRRAWLRRLSN
jgi:putative MATE family efflux protein